ncbi:MAG TPA: alpha-amylase [Elusimicrobia bacterium]|nr:alpha-amylase [Elusimicrobiota bacterium]HBT60619.1 alpha-amylase [Elusimicrobiota bacterium]
MEIRTPDWVQDAVFYQIFPDRFAQSRRVPKPGNLEPWASPPTACGFKGGDLLGAAERLDYLQDLGITAVYLTPIFASTANHRYHTHDYFSVDPILGGNQALRELLDAAHRRGIRVVLDGVFNHASRSFYQFSHTLENGAKSPYLDWFHFDLPRLKAGKPLDAYPRGPGPCRPGYAAWWNLPALPKFNTRTPAVREFIFQVAEHWLRFGIDGWRLDVPSEIDDDSFWREFRRRVKAVNPEAYIVGEIWGEARRWLRGDQFDAVMNYHWTKAVLAGFCDRLDADLIRQTNDYRQVRPFSLKRFSRTIDGLLGLYAPPVTRAQLNLLDSHDTPRFLSLAGGDETALRLAATFMFVFPGAPCIYYGDEIGLPGGKEPDCRRGFPWDRGLWNHGLRDFFKNLSALRQAHPALRRGSFQGLHAQDGIYALLRRHKTDAILAAFNLAREPRCAAFRVPWRRWLGVADGDSHIARHGRLELRLPPRSSLLLRRP